MAQTTRTPPSSAPRSSPPAAEQHPPGHQNATQQATPAPPPVVRPMVPQMPAMATDRNLLEQLRQIYQISQRHLPVPSNTKLSKELEDALEEIEKISNKAVTDYKPE